MCIQSDLKNKSYIISRRNFLDDYANYQSQEIDMTLSGKYLYKYPKFKISYSKFSEYPTHQTINELVFAIKKKLKIKNKEIIIGTGANGIIQNIVKILFKDSGNLVTPFLTFNQPEYAVTASGGYTKRVLMENDAKISLSNIINSIDEETKMIYICNPNNPTGQFISSEKIQMIARNTKKYVVIDESAIEFSGEKSMATDELPDNIIVVKSFSKAYGIANLRVGYMLCSKAFKELYDKNITVNEVSGISCEYAKKVFLSNNYKKNVKAIVNERKNLEKRLKEIGIEFYDSNSNTLFSKKGLSREMIAKFYKNDISVTIIQDQDEKLHIRIAVQERKTNKLFIKTCKEIFSKELS